MVIRRSLGRQLKALRVAAHKTLHDVAVTEIASKAKLSRIEGGDTPVRVADVIALCQLYGADEKADMLAAMARNTSRDAGWKDFTGVVPSWFEMWLEMEAAAQELHVFTPNLVPGLLQTPEYHRAVFQSDPVLVANDSLDGQLQLRAERQRRAFDRVPPLRLVAVMEEAAVRRAVGGEEVMQQQIEHLVDMSTRDHVDVLILANQAGAHPGMKGAFNRLSFGPADEPDVAYAETLAGGLYFEKPDDVARFNGAFDVMRKQSIAIREYLR